MAHDELHILVKVTGPAPDADIIKVVRTYLSFSRANEDRELIEEVDRASYYKVLPVPYIDN